MSKLSPITSRHDGSNAFEALSSAFKADAETFQNRVGWQGGRAMVDVYWHASAGIWGAFSERPAGEERTARRFWNLFGVDHPIAKSMLNITVEMNPPHQGLNSRTAAVFLHDDQGRCYIGHSGRVGGGRPGIGLSAFKEFASHLDWQEIETPTGTRNMVVIGPFQNGRLPSLLAEFVHTVADFKKAAVRH